MTTQEASARTTWNAGFVRQSAQAMLGHARAGRLTHIGLDESRLDAIVDYVIETTRQNYPALDMPFHARWRHFKAGARDLWAELDAATVWHSQRARLKAAYDLVIVSVLLDAGAGMAWRFREPVTGLDVSKSEGLGLASLTMFRNGLFSADPGDPLRVDATRLLALTVDELSAGFQVGPDNPMVGLDGRCNLLRRLGAHLAGKYAGQPENRRPSVLADQILGLVARDGHLKAEAILEAVLIELGPIWPAREGALPHSGDVWFHPQGVALEGWMPVVGFHKLSQWLSYSLIEPLLWTGHKVTEIDGLTGLPEYRNGGLFLDMGMLTLKDEADWTRSHEAGSELVIEWRALTVALLDIVAGRMRMKLGLSADELPLAKVLEGGTWAAGRRIAREKRADGGPPLTIISDGTVF
ncbi:MAG: DUF1688 family protein [Bosea sp. (in: a-proteobacteria)]